MDLGPWAWTPFLVWQVPAVSHYLAVAGIFTLIYAIAAVQIFGGRFGHCLDPLHEERLSPGPGANGTTDHAECLSLSRYNLSRHDSTGAPLTAFGTKYARHYEFPQWVQPDMGTLDKRC